MLRATAALSSRVCGAHASGGSSRFRLEEDRVDAPFSNNVRCEECGCQLGTSSRRNTKEAPLICRFRGLSERPLWKHVPLRKRSARSFLADPSIPVHWTIRKRPLSHQTCSHYSFIDTVQVRGANLQRRSSACLHTFPDRGACRLRPPWNVVFFGTDYFALETLKMLHKYSLDTEGAVVGRLEVVSLPLVLRKRLPVANYASDQGLPIHEWPDTGQCSQFDVGVVASFGRLLNEKLISQFPYGILNVHPSLLPKWRGPAPIIHTVLNGDQSTGVTIMQIRPKRFDVGPIVMQETFPVPPKCTSKELEAILSQHGAQMLISVLKHLPENLRCCKEQQKEGASFAPKITITSSCVRWEEQTPQEILRLERAIGYVMPLQAVWMDTPIKLLNLEEIPDSLIQPEFSKVPGAIRYLSAPDILAVRCKNGWVGVRTLKLKKKLSAKDFYNGYLHQWFLQKNDLAREECCFSTLHLPEKPKTAKQKPVLVKNL